MTNYIMAAALLAFLAAFLIGRKMIPWLIKLKFGQHILEVGPKWHMGKQGTPTMGGLMFIVASALAGIAVCLYARFDMTRVMNVLLFSIAFSFIGFIDDITKISKKKNLGLRAYQKLVLQLCVALVFLTVMRILGTITPTLYIPFFDVTFTLGWIAYLVLGAFIIVGFVNAVNLNDGLDGLAAGTTLPVMVFFSAVFLVAGEYGMSVYAAAVAGALLGFLIYNFPPARVFMGDTGSLFLGGAVCGMAYALDMPLVLITVGFVYALEAFSDIVQVGYFKLTHGKRIFKMAPIHHHFEMCGWSEKQITLSSAVLTSFLCAVTFLGILVHFGG